MTTPEAISALSADNRDVILMRVGGSVKLAYLSDAAQGKLNWVEQDELLKQFQADAETRAVSNE